MPNMRSINVVERLREKQAELGIETQSELAEMLDVTEATISRLYSGKRGAGAAVIMGMLKLWPDVFKGDGNGDRAGDEHHSGGGDDNPVHSDDLRLPGFAAAAGGLDD